MAVVFIDTVMFPFFIFLNRSIARHSATASVNIIAGENVREE